MTPPPTYQHGSNDNAAMRRRRCVVVVVVVTTTAVAVVWPLPMSSSDDGGSVAVVVRRVMPLASPTSRCFQLTFRLRSSFPSRLPAQPLRRLSSCRSPSRARVFPLFYRHVGRQNTSLFVPLLARQLLLTLPRHDVLIGCLAPVDEKWGAKAWGDRPLHGFLFSVKVSGKAGR